jgi:hypothetical protein
MQMRIKFCRNWSFKSFWRPPFRWSMWLMRSRSTFQPLLWVHITLILSNIKLIYFINIFCFSLRLDIDIDKIWIFFKIFNLSRIIFVNLARWHWALFIYIHIFYILCQSILEWILNNMNRLLFVNFVFAYKFSWVVMKDSFSSSSLKFVIICYEAIKFECSLIYCSEGLNKLLFVTFWTIIMSDCCLIYILLLLLAKIRCSVFRLLFQNR